MFYRLLSLLTITDFFTQFKRMIAFLLQFFNDFQRTTVEIFPRAIGLSRPLAIMRG